MKNYKISVVGAGFVGLTTSLGLASKGHDILCIDNDRSKIFNLKKNKIPFFEPYLKKNLKLLQKKKKIKFKLTFEPKKNITNVVFICVGTPVKKRGDYDLSSIKKIVSNLAKYKNYKFILVIKSTIFPGTIENIKKIYRSKNILFCSNPEFLREGFAWRDFMNPDRIIVGYDNDLVLNIMKKIYSKFKCKKIYTNLNTSEYIKILSNNLLSNLISFSNMMALTALKIGKINIKESFNSVKLDNRWFGKPASLSTYFHPGLGYGGYCLPKDTEVLSNYNEKKIKSLKFIKENLKINQYLIQYYTKKINDKAQKFSNIAILGVSFKVGSDDLRYSKSVELFKALKQKTKKKFHLYDPLVTNLYIDNKKYNIEKKLIKKKNTFYILANAEKKYINFLKKLDDKLYMDLRYII